MKKIFGFIKNFYFPTDIEDHLKVKVTVGRFLVTFLLIASGILAWIFVPAPSASVTIKNQDYTLDQKVIIDFTRPVKRNEITYAISPDVLGKWNWEQPYWGSKHLFTRLVFTPDSIYKPKTAYNVNLTNISNVIKINKTKSFSYTFQTQDIPNVATVSPEKGAEFVRIDTPLLVKLSQKNDHLADFNLEIEPKIDVEKSYDEKSLAYSFKPKSSLAQGTTYAYKIYRAITIFDTSQQKVEKKGDPEVVYEGTFRTQEAPGVVSIAPTGDHILINNNQIKVVFSQDMDRASVESNLEINPTIEGTAGWEDDKTLVYKITKNLNYATTYGFKVKAGAKNKTGGYLPQEVYSSFTTIGNAYVYSISPTNGAAGVRANTNISFSFDQAVDHASAESHFSITDGLRGSFSWNGNTIIFDPEQDLNKDSSYTVVMAAGVKSINGLESNRAFSSTFYTEQNIVKLAVPLDYQDYPLSCEVASLKMALAYKGVSVSELSLMNLVGYDPTPHVGNIWGDPYNAFVGSLSGRQNTTGYGVYWDPIARAAQNYRSAQAFTGWSASQLASTIANGNPVVMWGVYPGGYFDPWYTPDGKYIPAWKGEHVRTVIGFYGPASNPTKFIINDPISGQLTWSTSQFLSNWAAFGNAGVVVY